jgi:hypothetical protein
MNRWPDGGAGGEERVVSDRINIKYRGTQLKRNIEVHPFDMILLYH